MLKAAKGYNCLFRETFTSPTSVAKNGGVVVGTPTIKGYLKCASSSDLIEYPNILNECKSLTQFTILTKVKIGSSFANYQTLFQVRDTSITAKMEVGLDKTTGKLYYYNGTLYVSTNAVSADSTIWMAWTNTGSTIAFYNGESSLVANGSSSGAGLGAANVNQKVRLAGRAVYGIGIAGWYQPVYDFMLFSSVLSLDEMNDIIKQATIPEILSPSISLPMRSSYIDGSGNKVTENKGSLGGTVKLGDGSTATTMPTQLSPKGLSFDGTTDYLSGIDDPTGSYTVVTQSRGSVTFKNDLTTLTPIKTAGGYSGELTSLNIYSFVLSDIQKELLKNKLIKEMNV